MNITVTDHSPLNGVVPGVRGQRAFPTTQLQSADPFLMLDHIGPETVPVNSELGGGAHPHRGFETVSIFLAGSMEHVDSLGNQLRINAGGVQVMNAGRGILHGGTMRPDPQTGVFHEFQLWVNVTASQKMSPPTVATFAPDEVPVVEQPGSTTRVLTGTAFGVRSPAMTSTPTLIAHVSLKMGETWKRPKEHAAQTAWVYVIRGMIRIGDTTAAPHQTVAVSGADTLSIDADGGAAEWLFMTGEPLREPVAFGGPFVMSNDEEIEQAYADYRAGLFGSVS